MNLPYYLIRLTNQAEAIARLSEGIDRSQAQWKPAADEWSILEVVNHLYDEEIEDFRLRLQLTLENPQATWPANDTVLNVTERKYNERDLGESLDNFLDERTVSLEWLRSLDSPAWGNQHVTARVASRRVGDLMASWVAHDLLHLRQLVELNFYYQRQLAQPYNVDYAGDW